MSVILWSVLSSHALFVETSTRPPFRSTMTQPSQMGNFKHQSIRGNDRDRDREGDKDRERDIRDKEGQERLRSVGRSSRLHSFMFSLCRASFPTDMTVIVWHFPCRSEIKRGIQPLILPPVLVDYRHNCPRLLLVGLRLVKLAKRG